MSKVTKLYFNECGDLIDAKQSKIDYLKYLSDDTKSDIGIEEFQNDSGMSLSEVTEYDLENDCELFNLYELNFDSCLQDVLNRTPQVVISEDLSSDILNMDLETIQKVFEYFNIEWSMSEILSKDDEDDVLGYSITFKDRDGQTKTTEIL
ncbi:TPA: hypothetical protein N2964_000075 [Vibrio parahaemolyticus]|uniref:hypothetical protein n=1 Tax=Vibrio TaxID=662 RepID=UPI00040FEB60|nr:MULTISPECIES: hypothetical protein [Vibrio]MBM5414415.1 hypothetical protein [Vibrio parahaemolyticus]MBM5451373.1 hypothetical protein [Vibrio parahaemolyticus]MCF9675708.1 hypothetical protein [Vibrio parahaemolyticus]MCF9719157.1 hypothetical protein [Vibrio parahaemolyticus]MCF9803789.1 hypothetical protein [Vibrio parahaemolyticus]